MAICVATMQPDRFGPPWEVWDNSQDNIGVVAAYQRLYERNTSDVLCYLHDDVALYEEDWLDRVLHEFEDPAVGVVGFGGALRHGSEDLYKRPYRIEQLARSGYRSNTKDAEAHGERFTGECDVSVLDGFSLMVRRNLLVVAGGWPIHFLQFHNYDLWLSCIAHRLGYRVRMVGVSCWHSGGATSTTPQYQDWCISKYGKTDAQIHAEAHTYIYEEFMDVLPWRCV